MTFGLKLPITASPVLGVTTSNDPCYTEHEDFENGHRYSAMIGKSVSGTVNIFIYDTSNWGQSWEETQITAMTGGSTTGDQYVGSVCPAIDGKGLHCVWYGLGYAQIGATYYPSQKYCTSLLYRYRDADGVWGATEVIKYSQDSQYAQGYPRYRIYNNRTPCIAIDSIGNVHVVWTYLDSWNTFFLPGASWYSCWYSRRNVVTGAWEETVRFRYVDNNLRPSHQLPNIQVDSHDNPHITCALMNPVRSPTWGVDASTTVWFANDQQGDITGWPGWWSGSYYGSDFPHSDPMAEILCNYPSSYSVSIYARMALCPLYTEGTFDYPHCIYLTTLAPYTGVWHKYMDATGWHEERVNSISSSVYPTLAIGADGMIYALTRAFTSANWEYRKKALSADVWSAPETIEGIASPRPVHHTWPISYPLDGQDCSPFMASHDGWAKLFRCGIPVTDSYGYFM